MQKLNKNAVGLTLGSLVALAHLGWLILVGVGLAKPLYDLILKLHHISLSYTILPLSLGLAVGLLTITFIVGYIFGWVFATFWNKFSE